MKISALILSAAALVSSAAIDSRHWGAPTHRVDVGLNGLTFTPNNTVAAMGDVIEFHYFPKNHSVVQSSFNSPCITDLQNGFFSGFNAIPAGESLTTFRVVVNDTKPLWFYCAQNVGTHCQKGMVGSVNAPATGNTLSAFAAKAKLVQGLSTAPPNIMGGISNTIAPPPSQGNANIKFDLSANGEAATQQDFAITGRPVALNITAFRADLNSPHNAFCQLFTDAAATKKAGGVLSVNHPVIVADQKAVNILSLCCATSEWGLNGCSSTHSGTWTPPPAAPSNTGSVRVQLSGEGEFAVQQEIPLDGKLVDLSRLGNTLDSAFIVDAQNQKDPSCQLFWDVQGMSPVGARFGTSGGFIWKGLEVTVGSISCKSGW